MSAVRIERVALTVGDLDRAARFYADAFGFAVEAERRAIGEAWARLVGLRDADATIRTLRLGDERVELAAFDRPGAPYPASSRSNDLWFQHFALVTADIAAAWSRARAAGAVPVGAHHPVTLPARSGGVTAIKLRDPEGHPIELLAFPAGSVPAKWRARAAGGEVLGIDHTAIAVGDTGRTEAFATALLGFAVGARSLNVGPEQEALDGSFNAVVEVTALEPSDASGPHLELLCNRIPATGRPIPVDAASNDVAATRTVLAVADLDAVIDAAREARLRFVSRYAVRQADGRRAATLCDPDGHRFVLVEA